MEKEKTPKKPKREVGLRVREILLQRKMTIADLAKKAGKPQHYISSVLAGNKDMSLNSLILISKALDVPFGDMFYNSTNYQKSNATPEPIKSKQTDEPESEPALRALMKMLERRLRFPATIDSETVTELAFSIMTSMGVDRWTQYRDTVLKALIPAGLEIYDFAYLSRIVAAGSGSAKEFNMIKTLLTGK